MLLGRGQAMPGQGSTLAAAAPCHGQVALGAKPVAQFRHPGDPRAKGPVTLKGPQGSRLRLKRHLAIAWHRRRQRAALARPGQILTRQ